VTAVHAEIDAVMTTLLPIVEIAALLRPIVDVTEHDVVPASAALKRVKDGRNLSESQVLVYSGFRNYRVTDCRE
jgi:hypothetical protein